MSDLQILLDLQKSLQNKHGHDFEKMDVQTKEQYTKDMVLYLLEETHELLRETNFKTYKKVRKPVIKEKIEMELVDMFHFLLNLCLVWDVNAEDIMRAFLEKNKINVARVSSADY